MPAQRPPATQNRPVGVADAAASPGPGPQPKLCFANMRPPGANVRRTPVRTQLAPRRRCGAMCRGGPLTGPPRAGRQLMLLTGDEGTRGRNAGCLARGGKGCLEPGRHLRGTPCMGGRGHAGRTEGAHSSGTKGRAPVHACGGRPAAARLLRGRVPVLCRLWRRPDRTVGGTNRRACNARLANSRAFCA